MPYVIAIAGPNGAGKTTIATTFLREMLSITQYVNADAIARGLSEFDPESVAELLECGGIATAFESGGYAAALQKTWNASPNARKHGSSRILENASWERLLN